MTTLDQELLEQGRWRPLPGSTHGKVFRRLVFNEFLPPVQQADARRARLSAILRFAAAAVPHYRDTFRRLGLALEDIRDQHDLHRLPVLTRGDLQTRARQLQPGRLPAGEVLIGKAHTSGTTGQPVEVPHTRRSEAFFGILVQRQNRWWRFDPMGRYAQIRPPQDMPRLPSGKHVGVDETISLPSWPLLSRWFHTGPCFGFAHYNKPGEQVAWLERIQPDYLLSQSAILEQIALGFQGRPVPEHLRACVAISQQLSPAMRAVIERHLRVPVFESFGLNEIGMVASHCPDSGWYHVHQEHCLVETVDDDGVPCRPGDRGRIVVTALNNPAMPLIRYDSGDLAEIVDAPCVCGRTLPSFTGLQGRYRRIACLPPGSWNLWVAVQEALAYMPRELAAPLRQYQLHQYLDNTWELRLAACAPLSPEFLSRVTGAWREKAQGDAPPLRIVELAELPANGPGKFENFVSDFARAAERPAHGQARR